MRKRSTLLLLTLLASILMLPGVSSAQDSTQICDTDAIVEAVEGGSEEGTLNGMADDPVGTAASNNPVLTTLTAALNEAGLVDTVNSAEALTVFAPTDCAFAQLDPATLDAAMADPTGLLATVLGFHVIPGEQIASADLSGEYETVTGETLTVDGTTVGGQAEILVPDIQTANATVHLIDTVMMPPSMTEAAQGGAASEEPAADAAASEEPAATEEAAPTEEPAATEAAPTEEAAAAPTEEPAAGATAAPAGDDAAAPTGGVAAGAGGTAGSSSTPLVLVGVLAMIAMAGALVARRAS